MAATPYCVQADVENRISALGVSLRLDDTNGTPATIMAAIIATASSRINYYCSRQYSVAVLAANDWVKDRCVDIALRYLCARRGNSIPKSVLDIYEEAVDELKAVMKGSAQIPDAPRRKALAPVLSQPRAKLFPVPGTVIERGRSTGTPQNYTQRDDPLEPPDALGT